jgi:hypothetical protein
MRARMPGSARPALISRLSRSTITPGVPLGTQSAVHGVTSKPAIVSPMVGTSDNAGVRFADSTASARMPPDLMCGSEFGNASTPAWMRPLNRSVSIGAPP